ncbi:MAG TPA: hypothetical protein DCW72_00050 [Elusimicrobia bacterium]|nr:MAG: hypothetical protein A2X29_03880 [Elusimicrobia bacterium GWA2_64_40]HAN05271.1 hypothetical protein [Elusimicrobiota bacterium]HAU88670.1 hypothetical protein [Elusimicrobiota bacterium]
MKKLSIVSYGLVSPSQMTLESAGALRSCGIVYCKSADTSTAKIIRSMGIPLAPFSGRDYPGMLKDVLEAFKKHTRVGVLTYGNPFFLSTQISDIISAVPPQVEVEVLPGISSFDTLINMFAMSALSGKGLFIADLNSFMTNPEFEPGPDIFFFAPFRLNAEGNAKFRAKFIKALSGKYARRFPVYLVKCNPAPERVEVLKGCMSCLPALLKRCDEQHTLVIFSEDRLAATPSRLRSSVRDVCNCGLRKPALPRRQ